MKNIFLFFVAVTLFVPAFSQFTPSSVDPNDTYFTPGQVGIGLTDPKAKLDIRGNPSYRYLDESILRVTYAWPLPPGGNPPVVLENIFEIRQEGDPNQLPVTPKTRFVVKENGNVGIGVQSSDPALEDIRLLVADNDVSKIDVNVKGYHLIDGKDASLLLGRNTGSLYGEWGIEYNEYASQPGLNFWKPSGSTNFGNYFLFLADNGKISMGLDPSDANTFNGEYRLYVKDGIMTEKVKVAIHTTNDWMDKVFEEDYDLMPLNEVREFIDKEGHLPGVPSAEEVVESGLDLGKMDATLLQKIEELTLHVIRLQEQNDEMAKTIKELKK